ncbi:MAG: hypothetical protein AAGA48_30765 [Myxococcota bacterium]
MPPVLNQISVDTANAYVSKTTHNIERQLNHTRRPRPRALFPAYYKRAVCGRACGRSQKDTRDDLRAAAHWGLLLFETCGEPRERPRDVWEMRQVAGLLAAYGDAEQHVRLDGLPSSRWYHPPKPELEAGALAYRLFNRFLVTRKVADEDLRALDEQLAQSGLHPVHTQAIAPIAHCLVAIQQDNPHDFERSWGMLTNAFATVAQHGEFRSRIEGLLDPMALGLLALGHRHGFTMTVTSPYAPADLLGPPTVDSAAEPAGVA